MRETPCKLAIQLLGLNLHFSKVKIRHAAAHSPDCLASWLGWCAVKSFCAGAGTKD